MSTQLSIVNNFDEMTRLANAIAKSGLFGITKPEEALSLMAIAHAEGYSPALAARDYHIVKGRPTLKADAMLSRFQQAGGKVRWDCYEDDKVCGTFSHPQGGEVTVDWDMERAKRAGLTGNPTWQKYPRNMLRARVISEAIRTVFPGVGNVGMYTPEEVEDMDPKKEEPKNITPKHMTNTELLTQIMGSLSEEYEEVPREALREMYAKLRDASLSDADLPLMVREEFDQRFKRKEAA